MIWNVQAVVVQHAAEIVRVVHVHQVVAQPVLDVLVVLQLVEADAQRTALDVIVVAAVLAQAVAAINVVLSVLINVEINAKIHVAHHVMMNAKIAVKQNVMIHVNQQMLHLVQ